MTHYITDGSIMDWKTLQVLASPCLTYPTQRQQSRHLSIHEHQAMDLLKKNGILVPLYKVAMTADEAGQIAKEFGMLFHMYNICMFALFLNSCVRNQWQLPLI